jgi:chitodextrinase
MIPGRRLTGILLRAFFAVLLVGLVTLWGGETVPLEEARSAAASPSAVTTDPVVAAAGDIACDPGNSNYNGGLGSSNNCHQKYTSDLLVNAGLSGVLLLGDNQYYCGGYQAYVQSYDPTWGRVKSITYPAVGNHEYLTNGGSSGSGGTDCNSSNAGAAGHFRYFGAAAGDPAKGYYSFDIGTWHLIVLNSNCSHAGGCGETSPQGTWLRADLNAHPNFCTMAYWHAPLFSSGGRNVPAMVTFWDALYAANADLILAGHDHTYERFAAQRPDGTADSVRGIREFVVGSGGANHTSFTTVFANSEVRNETTFGVLKLTLHPASYDYEFVPEAGAPFTDSGTTACHGDQSDTTPPTAPTNLTATATAPNAIALSWTASTDNVGLSGYQIYRDGAPASIGSVGGTTTSYSDTGVLPSTAHTYTVRAIDTGGNLSPHSNQASATTPADTTPPSAPGSLSAVAPHGYQVNLSWTASTDNVGVAEYRVLRGGVQVGTSTTTSYSDTTVQAQTNYTYTVVARDVAGNLSGSSNSAVVTTPAAPTTLTFTPTDDAYVQSDQATANFGGSSELIVDGSPSRRTLLKFVVTAVRGRTVLSAKLRLRCTDAASNGGVFHRVADQSWSEDDVTWNNQPTADAATIASLGSVVPGTTYEVDVLSLVTGDGTYTVNADSTSSDGATYSSKEGSVPPQLVVTTAAPAPDTTRPSAPTNLTATPVSGTRVDLNWTAATDNVGVTGYRIFRNGSPTPIGTVGGATTSYADTTVVPATAYSYTVTAVDAAGNESLLSNSDSATTPDTVPPSTPPNLHTTAVSATSVELAWEAASDNVAVTSYKVWRDGQVVATVGEVTSYVDGGVAPTTHYVYTVQARDGAGNLSELSNATAVDTPAGGPTLACWPFRGFTPFPVKRCR